MEPSRNLQRVFGEDLPQVENLKVGSVHRFRMNQVIIRLEKPCGLTLNIREASDGLKFDRRRIQFDHALAPLVCHRAQEQQIRVVSGSNLIDKLISTSLTTQSSNDPWSRWRSCW